MLQDQIFASRRVAGQGRQRGRRDEVPDGHASRAGSTAATTRQSAWTSCSKRARQLGASHQAWQMNEINGLIWPSTERHRPARQGRVRPDGPDRHDLQGPDGRPVGGRDPLRPCRRGPRRAAVRHGRQGRVVRQADRHAERGRQLAPSNRHGGERRHSFAARTRPAPPGPASSSRNGSSAGLSERRQVGYFARRRGKGAAQMPTFDEPPQPAPQSGSRATQGTGRSPPSRSRTRSP